MAATGAVSIGDIFGSLILDDEFTSKLNAAADALDAVGAKWTKFSTQVSNAAQAFLPLSLAVAGAGTAATVASASFEASLTKLSTLAGVSADDLALVKQHILDLAPAVGIGPQALADAMTVVSSTVENTTTALSILDTAAKASAAGLGDAKDVARALTSIINSYGEANIDAARAGDILVATVKAGGAEAGEMAGVLGRVIPLAAQVGINFEEAGAFLATFTKLGVDASEATTALRGVITQILTPSEEAEKALMRIGTSSEGLRKSIKEKGLTEAMIDLLAAFKGNTSAAATVFGEVRALAGIMGTAGSQADTYRKVLDEVEKSQGMLGRATDAMGATTVVTWRKLTAEVGVAAIKFGDALAPALKAALDAAKPLLDGLVALADRFARLPQPVQTAAIAAGAFVAALSPALFVISGISKAIGATATAIGAVTKLFVAETAAVAADTIAVSANTAAQLENAAARTTAATGLKFAAGEQLGFAFALSETEKGLVTAEQALLPLSGAIEQTGAAAVTATEATGGFIAAIGGWPVVLGTVATGLVLGKDGLASLGSLAKSTASIVGSVAVESFTAFKDAAKAAGEQVVEFGGWLKDNVPGVDLFAQAVHGVRGALDEAAKGMADWANQAAEGNFTAIATALQTTNPLLSQFLMTLSGVSNAHKQNAAAVSQYQTAADAAYQATNGAAEHEAEMLRITTQLTEQKAAAAAKAAAEAAERAKQLSAAQQTAIDQLTNQDVVNTATLYAGALEKVDTVAKMTTAAQIKLAETMEQAIAIYTAAGKTIPEAWQRIADAARTASATTSDATKATIDQLNELNQIKLRQSGDATRAQVSDLNERMQAEIDAAKKAGTFSSVWLDATTKKYAAMKDDILVDFKAIEGASSRGAQAAQQQVEKAQETLSYMMGAGAKFTAADIAGARDRLEAARNAAAGFQQSSNAAIYAVQKQSDELREHVVGAMQPVVTALGELDKAQFEAEGGLGRLQSIEQMQAMFPGRKSGGGGGATGLMSNDLQGYLDMLAEQRLYQKLKNYVDQHPEVKEAAAAKGARPSWWNMGGAEAVNAVTASSPGGGFAAEKGFAPGAGMTNTFYVNGTAEDVARKVGDILMRRVKTTRLLPSAG